MFEPDKTRVERMFEFSVRRPYAVLMQERLHGSTDKPSDLHKHHQAGPHPGLPAPKGS